MSASPSEAVRNAATLRTMTHEDLDAVMAIEQSAYSHPWSRGNFRDSLNPLFDAHCLWLEGELLGYFLAMHGVEEMHLLNITVAPARQGQGWGHMMLDALSLISRSQGAQWLWLEVADTNENSKSATSSQSVTHTLFITSISGYSAA